jgi:hypothetical protein
LLSADWHAETEQSDYDAELVAVENAYVFAQATYLSFGLARQQPLEHVLVANESEAPFAFASCSSSRPVLAHYSVGAAATAVLVGLALHLLATLRCLHQFSVGDMLPTAAESFVVQDLVIVGVG